MVKRSSTLIKEGKLTLGIDEERLHRTEEKSREIISKGKEEKWEGQTKAAYQKNGFAIAQQNPGDKMKEFQVWIMKKNPIAMVAEALQSPCSAALQTC